MVWPLAVALVALAGCTTPNQSVSAAPVSAGAVSTGAASTGTMSTAAISTAAISTAAISTVMALTTSAVVSATVSATGLTGASTTPTVRSDLAGDSAHHVLAVDGETFGMKIDYWTTTPVSGWQVGGIQNLHLAAYLDPKAAAPQVLVDGVTVQWRVAATVLGLDGVLLGELVDRPAGAGAGFLISKTYPYNTVSVRAGVGQELVDRWAALAPGQPLTEPALRRAGVYAITVSIRYDLLIRSTGETVGHRRTVLDQLDVPLPAA